MTVSARISKRPISVDAVIGSVRSKSAGGIVTFVGTVRDNSHGMGVTGMELEAAVELALKDLRRIADKAEKEFATSKIAVAHRIGRLRVGDVIAVIAVSAPHRKGAFAACKFVIDELKKSTPIWKKEFEGGTKRWVEGEV